MQMPTGRPNTGSPTSELLDDLRSDRPDTAWKEFLESYSATILLIASRYEQGQGRVDDCYLYVCERLSDQGFRRLLSYRPEGPASFRSWLNVVVSNLCIDWRRRSRGRPRPFKSIRTLSDFEQMVFKYRIQRRLGLDACIAAMRPQFPDLTRPELITATSRINGLLTQKQRFLLSIQPSNTLSLDRSEKSQAPKDPGPGPEKNTRLIQEKERLQQVLNQLSPAKRLVLKLRYEQDLSLKEIARLMRLGDPFRARRRIQAALDELEEKMKS